MAGLIGSGIALGDLVFRVWVLDVCLRRDGGINRVGHRIGGFGVEGLGP
jgi:hypothetical protein